MKIKKSVAYIANYSTNPQIILSTMIFIRSKNGKWYQCIALLNSGSQSNYIITQLSGTLQLTMVNINVPIVGVGGSNTLTN